MKHVTDEEIGLFLAGRMAPADLRRALRHLASRCRRCCVRVGRVAEAVYRSEPWTALPPPDGAAYDAALDRAFAKVLAEVPRRQEERRCAAAALDTFRNHPRPLAAAGELDEDLPAWPMVETLIQLSQEARFRDPVEMLHLAIGARIAANSLRPEQYGGRLVTDLRMRALGELGNAWRVNEQYEEADRAFAEAGALWTEGTGDPLVLARLLDLEASLRRAQRHLPESIELLETVYQLYERTGERHLAGRALIKKGINTYCHGRPGEAAGLLRQGMTMIDPRRDPQLLTLSQNNLLLALTDAGEVRQARRLLLASGLRRKLAAEPLSLLRLRWIEGKIHLGLGRHEPAEVAFQEVRDGFLQRGLEYDAALVGLELLDAWLRQGRNAEVRELAVEILETFEGLQVKREALRAMRYLEAACQRKAATPELVRQVAVFLNRLEWEPRLQFAL